MDYPVAVERREVEDEDGEETITFTRMCAKSSTFLCSMLTVVHCRDWLERFYRIFVQHLSVIAMRLT